MPPTSQPISQPPLQPNVLLILAALGDGPAHGYRIRQEVLARSDGAARLDPGHLYRLIVRLVDEGMIAETKPPADEDRDDERRKYYALTLRGRKVLRAEVDRLAVLVSGVRASLAGRPKRS